MNHDKCHFSDDYSDGGHPALLCALSRTNAYHASGYGTDAFTAEAERLMRTVIGCQNADVHFVASGTQANLVALSSMLRTVEAVITAESGHINLYEAGAVEALGHKLIVIASGNGKIEPARLRKALDEHDSDHMVIPRVVYVSQATELGTIYTKTELTEIHEVCREGELYLYVDGSRIGNSLTAGSDLLLHDLANLADIFCIGGTKNGGVFGEAIVVCNPLFQGHFRHHMRQKGALLSKMRSVSIQFIEFFERGLYFENARHANETAQRLAAGIRRLGYRFLVESPTNMIFPIFPDSVIAELETAYDFHVVDRASEWASVARLVCSWATATSDVERFLCDLKAITAGAIDANEPALTRS